MEAFLIQIIMMGLASAVSPTLLAVAVLLISSKKQPRLRVIAFLSGAALTLAVIGVIIISRGSISTSTRPSTVSAAIDIILGLLLIFFGIRARLIKPAKTHVKKNTGSPESKSTSKLLIENAGLGIALTATNGTSLIFYLAAAKKAAESGLGLAWRILSLFIVGILYLLPILIPLLVTLAAPDVSKEILNKVNMEVKKYGPVTIAVISIVFGVYLIAKGFRVLI